MILKIQIDIFLYERINNKLRISNAGGYDHFLKYFPGDAEFEFDQIFPVQRSEFEHITVFIPNKIEQVCRKIWGNYPPPLLPIHQLYPHEGPIIPDQSHQHNRYDYPYLYKENYSDLPSITLVSFGNQLYYHALERIRMDARDFPTTSIMLYRDTDLPSFTDFW